MRVIAADCAAWFQDARTDLGDWRCLGSEDQPDQIFVAAQRSVRAWTLAVVAIRAEKLLPEGVAGQEIGRAGLSLFTNDNSDGMLTQR